MLPDRRFKPPIWALVCLASLGGSLFFFVSARWLGTTAGLRQASGESSAGFHERARQAGIDFHMNFLPGEQGEKFKTNLYDHGCGLAVGDFNGDGYDDIFFCNQLGKCALYRNNRDGTFQDVTEDAGVGLGDRICVAATWADFDNDGHQDLFVTSTRGGNVLFKNLGNGRFKDVTEKAGLTYVGHSMAAISFDYDNDGYVDLLVTNTAQWTQEAKDASARYYPGGNDLIEMVGRPKEFNLLYRNNGDGTFTNVTEKAGLKGQGWCGDAAVFDYNEDGWLDLLTTNMFGRSQLYRNNGDGTFTDVTEQTLLRTSWGASGVKVFDFNNDGKLDVFIADMHSDMWLTADLGYDTRTVVVDTKKYPYVTGPRAKTSQRAMDTEKEYADKFRVRYREVVFGNTLFKNLGGGKFDEISDQAGMETWWPWGAAPGDFDNDGYEDVFLPSGMGYPFYYWRNYLMMNNGNESFTDQSRAFGIEPPSSGTFLAEKIGNKLAARSSRSAAVADFDGDGRLEIVTSNFNDRPYYFKNNLPRKNYIAFKLQGTKSNRDAIGALVKLHIGNEVMVRQVHPAGGYLSQSSKTLHFGLGDRAKIDFVKIKWPGREKQIIRDPPINCVRTVVEP